MRKSFFKNPVKAMKYFIALALIFLSLTNTCFSQSLDLAVDKAIGHFVPKMQSEKNVKRIVISILNFHTLKHDNYASEIETVLYFSLEKKFPELKRILLSESTAGVPSSGTLFLSGTYNKQGEKVDLNLKLLKGLHDGELISQIPVSFTSGVSQEKTLVAILDIESKVLSPSQKKIYSEVFRSTLNEIDAFELASSAEVDKMSPDDIQQTLGCTRDECATIVGQQMGVDRVISTSLIKRSENSYFLSGKLIDIKDGSIVRAVNVNYSGDINNLDFSFQELAKKIANVKIITKAKKKNTGGKDILIVFNLDSNSEISEEAAGLAARMQEELLRSQQFILVEQNEYEMALNKLGYQKETCVQYSCAMIVGKELGADKAIIGTVKKIAGKYWLVNASLLDINNQRTIRTESIRSEGNFFQLLGGGISTLVTKLLQSTETVIPVEEEVQPEPEVIPEEPFEPEEPVAVLEEPQADTGSYLEVSYGFFMSYSPDQLKTECASEDGICDNTDGETEIKTKGSPNGYVLHFSDDKDDEIRFGLALVQVSQEIEANLKTELTHTGLEMDFVGMQKGHITFGMGIGLYSTNINTVDGDYTAGTGVSISLIKLGYVGETFGAQISHYSMSGESTSTQFSVTNNRDEEYKHSWNASAFVMSFTLLF